MQALRHPKLKVKMILNSILYLTAQNIKNVSEKLEDF